MAQELPEKFQNLAVKFFDHLKKSCKQVKGGPGLSFLKADFELYGLGMMAKLELVTSSVEVFVTDTND